MTKLVGIHSVREALASGRALERVVVARGRGGERIQEIVELARSRNVPVRFEDRAQLDRLAETAHHQGIVGLAAAKPALAMEDLFARARTPGLMVLLDGVEDPRNLGAIVRTALAAGADGIVIPERRAAGLTDTVAQTSAGALEHLPVARVKNLARAIEELKAAGYWLVGLDERAEKPYTSVDFTGPIAIVLGGEGKGLHELTRKLCDFLAAIPTTGPVRSLNVSVVAGVVLFEALRQRAAKSGQHPAALEPR
ncbi:MAG TPA: 23S rRNA (guanosine(2251)-2'-O)-methyltransferase RlmB [Candidatus Acidoferrales bacterium]|nr:23S rRNA (guanosine(2251)-2'-O)-methyltransferase RlmB [Candidatus Acidoferrales bacterium]